MHIGRLPDARWTRCATPVSAVYTMKSREARSAPAAEEDAVFNLPNLLSAARLALCIPIVALVLVDQPAALLAATALFALAAISDNLDGRLARKRNQVSDVGIFLDLTADKVFTGAIGVACVQAGMLPAWIPITILSRDFVVTGLRSVAASRGRVISAGERGKQKQTLLLVGLG